MTDTPQVVYTHADASTINIFTTSLSIIWEFPNKTVERQPNKVGITVDPNMVYRVVECSAIMTGDNVDTLNTMLMPAAIPTYDGTDPKITVVIDTDDTFTILCAVTSFQARDMGFGNWSVSITFTERSL